jgi:hypothetical protein
MATLVFLLEAVTGWGSLKISSSSSSCGFKCQQGTIHDEDIVIWGSDARETYSTVLGFRNTEPDHGSLDSAPDGKDDVGLPSDSLEADRPDIVVE